MGDSRAEEDAVYVFGAHSFLFQFQDSATAIDAGPQALQIPKSINVNSWIFPAPTKCAIANGLRQNEERFAPLIGAVPIVSSGKGQLKQPLEDLREALRKNGGRIEQVTANFEPLTLYKSLTSGRLDLVVLDGAQKTSLAALSKVISNGSEEMVEKVASEVGLIFVLLWYPANQDRPVKRILYTGTATVDRIISSLEKSESSLPLLTHPRVTSDEAKRVKLSPRAIIRKSTLPKTESRLANGRSTANYPPATFRSTLHGRNVSSQAAPKLPSVFSQCSTDSRTSTMPLKRTTTSTNGSTLRATMPKKENQDKRAIANLRRTDPIRTHIARDRMSTPKNVKFMSSSRPPPSPTIGEDDESIVFVGEVLRSSMANDANVEPPVEVIITPATPVDNHRSTSPNENFNVCRNEVVDQKTDVKYEVPCDELSGSQNKAMEEVRDKFPVIAIHSSENTVTADDGTGQCEIANVETLENIARPQQPFLHPDKETDTDNEWEDELYKPKTVANENKERNEKIKTINEAKCPDILDEKEDTRSDENWQSISHVNQAQPLLMTVTRGPSRPKLSRERYFDFVTVPNRGDACSLTTFDEAKAFFDTVRSAIYVLPSKDTPTFVLEALLTSKKSWGLKLKTTVIHEHTDAAAIELFLNDRAIEMSETGLFIHSVGRTSNIDNATTDGTCNSPSFRFPLS